MFSHIIYYVADVEKSLQFFNKVFKVEIKFVHESGAYAELLTEGISLAFASDELGSMNLPHGYHQNSNQKVPSGCEIVFTTHEIERLYQKAIDSGGLAVADPVQKPWGQKVAYVRDPNGILIELASPMQ